MPFNSLLYLLVFLPGLLLGWWKFPGSFPWRLFSLVIGSYIFIYYLASGHGLAAVICLASATGGNFYLTNRLAVGLPGRRSWLWLGVVMNLGVLACFKYLGLYARSLSWLVPPHPLGNGSFPDAHALLPLGISFYTFSSLSYVLDVYRGREKPETDLLKFAAFLAIFPKIAVGPIMRYGEFRKQVQFPPLAFRRELAAEGLQLLAVGLFKKAIVADTIAPTVSQLLENPGILSWISAWGAAIGYSLQLYFDFSGYSEIACGSALLLGFRFPQNFNSPFKAESMIEFWQRWHASLSYWFRDYVFEPLAWKLHQWRGAHHWVSNLATASVVSMALCGLWHGSEWKFLFYGLGHGFAIAVVYIYRRLAKGLIPNVPTCLYRALTYLVVCLLFVVFVSPDWAHSLGTFRALAGFSQVGNVHVNTGFLNFTAKQWLAAPLSARDGEISGFYLLVIAVLLGIVNWAPNVYQFGSKHPRIRGTAIGVGFVTALLCLGASKPFAYLQF